MFRGGIALNMLAAIAIPFVLDTLLLAATGPGRPGNQC